MLYLGTAFLLIMISRALWALRLGIHWDYKTRVSQQSRRQRRIYSNGPSNPWPIRNLCKDRRLDQKLCMASRPKKPVPVA